MEHNKTSPPWWYKQEKKSGKYFQKDKNYSILVKNSGTNRLEQHKLGSKKWKSLYFWSVMTKSQQEKMRQSLEILDKYKSQDLKHK